ncbi:hypothetical protein Bpfe_029529 [Biomphalaria pfeifferi]|uniref:Uncharacterized protein n=1 Tax=Biomphalaria pfeifferi TaxID=112525 RepID=A0AAD8EUP2_BIOPF|nr:hypothetical protein Bpfe_029529 [Biomphalaria pfeifferi]
MEYVKKSILGLDLKYGSVILYLSLTVLFRFGLSSEAGVPKLVNLFVTEQNDLRIEVDTGISSPSTLSVVYQDFSLAVKPLCTVNCSGDDTCLCEFDNTDQYFIISANNVTLIINVSKSDSAESQQVKQEVCLMDYVIPGCVRELSTLNVSAVEAVIQFRPSKETAKLISFMQDKFLYSLELWASDDSLQLLTMSLAKDYLFDADLFEPDYGLQYASITFDSLTESTHYTLLVTGIVANRKGCTQYLNFTTLLLAPSSPPQLDMFTYSRFNDQTGMSSLWLMWKPEETNGIKYHLEISSDSEPSVYFNLTTNYILQANLPPKELVVEIWSLNDIGQSQNASQILIPFTQDNFTYNVIIEILNDSHAFVYANFSNQESIQDIAFHVCESEDTNQKIDICLDYPYTKMLNKTRPFQNLLQVLFFIVVSTKLPESITLEQNVTYVQYLDKRLMYKETVVVANVTLNAQTKPMNLSNSDILFHLRDTHTEDQRRKRSSDSYHLRDTHTEDQHRKRSFDSYHLRDTHTEDQRRKRSSPSRHLRDTYTEDRRKKRSSDNPQSSFLSLSSLGASSKFFISIKSEGFWQGMKKSQCYFSRQLDVANVIVHNENGFLTISQKCDPAMPKQFLVRFYEIYSAPNNLCGTDKRQLLATLDNSIFGLNIFKLPSEWTFICVISIGDSANNLQVVENPFSPESTFSTKVIIIIVVCIAMVCILIFIMIGWLIYKCIHSKKYFNEMVDTSKNYVVKTSDFQDYTSEGMERGSNESDQGNSDSSDRDTSSPSDLETYQNEKQWERKVTTPNVYNSLPHASHDTENISPLSQTFVDSRITKESKS